MTFEEAINPPIHMGLSHLSDNDLKNIVKEYNNPDYKVREVCEKYNVEKKYYSRLRKILPPIVHLEDLCPYCNIPLWSEQPLRNHGRYYLQSRKEYFCPSCNHKKSHDCKCISCKMEEKQKKEYEQIEIQRILDSNYSFSKGQAKSFYELSTTIRLYVMVLVNHCLGKDSHILPFTTIDEDFTPNSDYSKEIFDLLEDARIMIISPHSDTTQMSKTETGYTYIPSNVIYHINIQEVNTEPTYLSELYLGKPFSIQACDVDSVLILWKRIIYLEMENYLLDQMTRLNFHFNPGDKTEIVLRDMVDYAPPSHIMSIIYYRMNNALRRLETEKINRRHAANSVITALESYIDRYKLGEISAISFNRSKIPQSTISQFLFNKILKLGSAYIDAVPNREYILSLIEGDEDVCI